MTAFCARRLGTAVLWCSLFLLFPGPAARANDGPAAPEPAAAAPSAPGPAASPTPPPAAATLHHGARAKAGDGTLLVYDGVAGAYRAPALGDAFWIGDRFYRRDSGVWLTGPAATGPWQLLPQADVPAAARDCCPAQRSAASVRLPSGIEAVYEPRLKAFKVAGHKGVFLHDATFYRYDNGLWLGSSSVDGPWAPATPRPLPTPLRKAVGEPTDGQTVTLASGEVLVWDGHAKVFAMRDKPNVVLHEAKYFEKRGARWFESSAPSAAFVAMDVKDVPAPVRFRFRNEPGRGAKAEDGAKAARPVGAAKPAAAGKAAAASSKKAPPATDSGDAE